MTLDGVNGFVRLKLGGLSCDFEIFSELVKNLKLLIKLILVQTVFAVVEGILEPDFVSADSDQPEQFLRIFGLQLLDGQREFDGLFKVIVSRGELFVVVVLIDFRVYNAGIRL